MMTGRPMSKIQKCLYSVMLQMLVTGIIFLLTGVVNAASTPTPTTRLTPTPTQRITLEVRLAGPHYSCGVYVSPPGVLINANQTFTYTRGVIVSLNAISPPPEHDPERFSYWSGDIGTANPYQSSIGITMDRSKIVTANFTTGPGLTPTSTPTPTVTPTPGAGLYTLSLDLPGNGFQGTVEVNPPGVKAQIDTAFTYPAGTVVSLKANGSQYDAFVYWMMGGVRYFQNPISITMDGNKSVSAGYAKWDPTPTSSRRRTTPTPTQGPADFAVTYVIQSDWGNGATVSVTIKNNSTTATNSWTIAWTFPGSQTITTLWNGTYTQIGASVTVNNVALNGTIPANGGTVNFGFNLSYSGSNAKPTSFTLNGAPCASQ